MDPIVSLQGRTIVVTGGVLLALYKSRWGLRVRATVGEYGQKEAVITASTNTVSTIFHGSQCHIL